MGSWEDADKKKRIAIISICTFLMVAMVMATSIVLSIKHKENRSKDFDNNKTHAVSTMKAVEILCQPTDYKKECEESLKAEANTTDTRKLIQIAFNITIERIGNSLKKTNLMHKVEKDHKATMALDTCKQLMDLSINGFNRSLERIRRFNIYNFDNILTNLKVWLSGAITYQETCLDGFENINSDAGEKMRDVLTKSMHMSSNVLAIIYALSKTLSDLNATNVVAARGLLQDSEDQHVLNHDELLPSWVDDGSAVRRFLHTSSQKLKPHVVVAKDGSGKFKRINEALKMVPKKNKKPFIIYIRKGVYHEYVEVTKQMTHVVFVGDGRNKTRITGNKNFMDGINTYRTSTVVIEGDYFVAMNMGFENSAGPHKHQAVAIRVQSDKSIFYKCSFDGYQDTLYAHTHRQFYRDCTISGTIDFIFGDAIAVFQNCTFILRKPLKNQSCIVTAQGRKERYQPSGIVIQGGSIVSSHEYHSVRFKNKTYLARPWKNYSRTIFLDTYIDDVIQCNGYVPWQGSKGTISSKDTCFYAEYNNDNFPGSNKSKLVNCNGIKKLTKKSASSFLPSKFFHKDDWIKVTRIPYQSGMASTKH